QQIPLRLRNQEGRGQADLVASLLIRMSLLGEGRPGARRVHAFGRAPHLPRRLTDGFGHIQPQARDPLGALLALDLRTGVARLFVAVPERVADGHADAPRRIVRCECLTERVAEAAVARTDEAAGKVAGAKKLGAAEPAATIRRLQTYVRQSLIAEKIHVRLCVLQVNCRA